MIDLVGPIIEQKQKKIGRSPCKSNRASSLGYFVPELEGCVRRGVYERTSWEQKELHDVRVQMIFDEGNNQEQQVLKDLATAGIQIIEQQSAGEWKEYQITYHLDGMAFDENTWVPVEIKSMSPHIFSAIKSFEDFKKKPWTRSYMCQIMVYMLGKNVDRGIFILKDKSSGQLKQIDVTLDYELAEACIRTAESINKHIQDGTLPDRIEDREKCKECPFKLLCLPEVNFGSPLQIADDPQFEKRIDHYKEIAPISAEAEAEYEIIRERCKATADAAGQLKILIGKWKLEGKKDSRGAFRLNIDSVD